MRKLRLDPSERYNIYAGPSFADIQKEPFLFEEIAASLSASEAANYPRAGAAKNVQLVISYAAFSKDDEPAAVLDC